MNELQQKYGNRSGHCSLQIFGFPSNQFGYQEPAENHELMNCIKYVRPGFGFVPAFPLAKKGDVNGMYEQPIYTFLKARCPAPMGLIANRSDITWQPIRNNDISWNFQKWLIKHDGQPYKRYTSRTTPESIEDDIAMLLDQCTAAVYGSGNATSSNVSTLVGASQTAPQKPAQAAPLPQTFATETAPGPMQPSGVAPSQPVQPSAAQNAAQQPQQQQTQAAQQAPKANQKKRSLLFDRFQ